MATASRLPSPTLHMGGGFELPIEAVTETFAIIANRGGGKSSTARVMAEELDLAGQPVIVLDPKGDWHGIRTSADGKHAGRPFVILGGDHGDLPLHEGSGALVANTLSQARASAVIDLSALSKTKARTFATAFAEQLYRVNRLPLHLVIDEADILVPQRAAADTMRLLGAMEDLAKRGRHRGIGVTIVSQRIADVSKSALDLMETLIVLRVTGPKTRKAIMDWVDDHTDDPEQMRQLLGSLKTLEVGHGWVWSPGWLGQLQQVTIRPIDTLDTHATPRPGVTPRVAKTKAQVDIDALGQQMAQLRDDAQLNDPAALRRRIRELETTPASAPPRVERVEVAVPTPVSDPNALADLENLRATLAGVLAEVDATLERMRTLPTPGQVTTAVSTNRRAAPVRRRESPRQPTADRGAAAASSKAPTGAATALPKAQRLVLEVLASYGERDASAVAVLAGYSSSGGGYRNALSALRTAGLIAGQATLRITPEGLDVLGPVPALPRGDDLREHWKSHSALSRAHRAVLDALAETYPQPWPVADLAAETGYAPTGGGFRNALSRLRSLGLISGRDPVALNPDLID